MSDSEKQLDEDTMRSDMLAKLLLYMLLHRKHPVTIQELSEALWDEEETENLAGALKNLMYRLRNLLKKHLGEQEYIITGRGTYSWNQEITVWLDTEQFEGYCEAAKKAENEAEQMHFYESERYEDAERICADGLKYDMADEWLHCLRIKALMRQNKQKLAMECYEQAAKVLYDALGVRNSAQLKTVYEELLSMSKGSEAEGLERIHEDMQEKDEPDGAYICGYPVFQAIYRLEARKNS